MSYKLYHIFIFIFILFVAQSTVAQSVLKIDAVYDHEIGFEIDLNTASTLNNAMLNASGFLDDDLKNENLNRLNGINRGGSYSDIKLFYRQDRKELWGVKNLGFYFAFELHRMDDYRFTDDLYKLVFYGNKQFAGQKADLAKSGSQSISYYQLKAGLQRKSINKKHRYGANIALNIGRRFNYFQFNDPSYIYTDPKGTQINLQMNASFRQSDTSNTEWYQVPGIGASVDLFYEFRKKDHYSILFSIENLGIIHWDNNTILFDEDQQLNFSGIEVDNIFDMPNPLIQSSDTLMDYLYLHSSQKGQRIMIPADLKLQYQQYFLSRKILASALVHYRLFSYALPLYQLDATYKINSHIKLGPILSYGGYTAFNAGLKFELNFAKNYNIRLESRYITGFAQHSFSGIGGFINFTYKI
ncbi:MAG: hypothetical protein DRI84_05510 [Bacteroidetes bacterium]|nr:MAG: hypothetical protein DRI84_05510 [Bacteroidota bacterium]